MGMFVLYKRMSKKDLRKCSGEAIRNINKWFKNNPSRKDCKAELWYGRRITIPRGKTKEKVTEFLNECLSKPKTVFSKRLTND